jgi:hypothetical protein
MLSTIMTDPFATAAPATLISSMKALQSVLANCWPRIPKTPWQDEIINDLVLCWLNLIDDKSTHLNSVQADIERELVKSADVLAAVLEAGDVELSTVVAPLIAKEPLLGRLFSNQ